MYETLAPPVGSRVTHRSHGTGTVVGHTPDSTFFVVTFDADAPLMRQVSTIGDWTFSLRGSSVGPVVHPIVVAGV